VKEILRGVQIWSVFSERKGYAFNGYAVSTEQDTLLIDPPDAGEDGWLTVDRSSLSPVCGSPTATTAGRPRRSASATA
jgi:hypothetical protein